MSRFVLTVLVLLTSALPAVASADRNAALEYWRIWAVLPESLNEMIVEQSSNDAAGWMPDDELSGLLEASTDHIERIVEVAAWRTCDFQIEYEAGFGAELPHLAKMRASARLLAADARRLAQAGDVDAAAARVGAIFGLGAQTRSDQIIISSLVGIAMITLAADEVDMLLTQHDPSEAARRSILDSIREHGLLRTNDPIGMLDAIRMERLIIFDWCTREFTGPDAGERFLEAIAPLDDDLHARITEMDGEALHTSLKDATRYYDDVLGAWNARNAADQIQSFGEDVEAEAYGVTGRVIVPALGRAHQRDVDVRELLKETAEKLRN